MRLHVSGITPNTRAIACPPLMCNLRPQIGQQLPHTLTHTQRDCSLPGPGVHSPGQWARPQSCRSGAAPAGTAAAGTRSGVHQTRATGPWAGVARSTCRWGRHGTRSQLAAGCPTPAATAARTQARQHHRAGCAVAAAAGRRRRGPARAGQLHTNWASASLTHIASGRVLDQQHTQKEPL